MNANDKLSESVSFEFKRIRNGKEQYTKEKLEEIEYLVRKFCQENDLLADIVWQYAEKEENNG